MHRCEVSSAAGVGDVGDRYDVVGKRGEKACRPRHKREESALNITELRSDDDDIQGRGAWSFRPLAFNAVMAAEPAARIHSGKCPGFRGKAVYFPGNFGKLWTAENLGWTPDREIRPICSTVSWSLPASRFFGLVSGKMCYTALPSSSVFTVYCDFS